MLFIINAKDVSLKFNTNTKTASSSVQVKDVFKKIEGSATANSSQGKITLTEEDLNLLIGEYLKNILSSPETKISNEKISISGTLEDFLKLKALLTISPKIENKKLSLEITDIKIGFIKAPGFVKDSLSDAISKNIEQKINTEGAITELVLENGKMTIILKETKE